MRLFQKGSSGSQARPFFAAGLGLLLGSPLVQAGITLDINSPESIKQAAGTAAYGLLKNWYNGNQTGSVPGNLPAPYYWWEAGAMMMCLIDYWYYTGDSQYNSLITEAIIWQSGSKSDFMTPNQTRTEGNDDQSFWGFAAMDAAELKFPNPPSDSPQWLALAQGVFNDQAIRWDQESDTCGGGLRWQIFPFNAGWNYKNGISNGCFFSMGARLARYTGNNTYATWATKVWDWSEAIGIASPTFSFYDGTDDTTNCTSINHIQWSYSAGVYLHGCANMWNITQDEVWKTRVDGIIATAKQVFFTHSVMYESACEPNGACNNDQRSFKAYFSRWLAATTQLCPWTEPEIMLLLQSSATAAAQQCSGGEDGNQCGLEWTKGPAFDGHLGPGEQMAAMSVFGSLLVGSSPAPVTAKTGGISKGDTNAGQGSGGSNPIAPMRVTTGDRVGAGFLTTFIVIWLVAGAVWMVY